MKVAGYTVHPAAAAMPRMADDDFARLKADIADVGELLVPVELYEGKVIDGINRLRACEELGIEADTIDVGNLHGRSPTGYVVSLNLCRRHLTASQKAAVAAELLPEFEAEAKERERTRKTTPEIIPESSKGDARGKAAEAVEVNPRYVSDAKALKEKAPAEFEKVKAGEKSLPQAKRDAAATDKPKRPAKNGAEVASPKARRELQSAYGKLQRAIDDLQARTPKVDRLASDLGAELGL